MRIKVSRGPAGVPSEDRRAKCGVGRMRERELRSTKRGSLDPGLKDVAVGAFDQAGAEGQVEREDADLVESMGAIAEVAERCAHGGRLVRPVRGLLAGAAAWRLRRGDRRRSIEKTCLPGRPMATATDRSNSLPPDPVAPSFVFHECFWPPYSHPLALRRRHRDRDHRPNAPPARVRHRSPRHPR